MALTTHATMAHGHGSMYARPALPQFQSLLLRLPTELRLQICDYMTLSPTTTDWNGAFFSCRQIHQDMLDQLHCRHGAIVYLQPLPDMMTGTPHSLFSWIHSITVVVDLSAGWTGCSFIALYGLHLDNLQILLIGDPMVHRRNCAIATPYGDLTTVGPPDLATPSGRLRPFGTDAINNCKKITLTLDQLADADGAEYKKTSYYVAFEGTDALYLFTIIQDKVGNQVERSYTFDTRFEMPTLLPPINEAETAREGLEDRSEDGWEDEESDDWEGVDDER